MIGQSLININSGGRGRLSGIVAALSLLAFILFASDLIEIIPIAALVGVMFVVVIGTFEWASFRMFGKVPLSSPFEDSHGQLTHTRQPKYNLHHAFVRFVTFLCNLDLAFIFPFVEIAHNSCVISQTISIRSFIEASTYSSLTIFFI